MHGWDANTIGLWVTTGLALIGALFAVGKWITGKIEASDKKNDEQLREQRRIKREVFGEDPDNPGGAKQASIRELIGTVIDQTRPLVDTVGEHGRRLGKVEDRLDNVDSRLAEVERVVLRQIPPL